MPNLIARLLIVVPAFLGTPLSYVLTALVFHMLMGVQAPAYAALITRIYQPELRGRLMAYVRVAMGVLMIPLSFLIGLWIDRSGPEGPLLAAAITGAVSVLSLNQVRETAGTSQTTAARPTLRELVMFIAGNRGLLVFFAATTFAGFGNILSSPLYQIIQVKTLQLSNVEIGIARMVYYGCLLTAYFVVGWAVDRFSPKRTLVYGIAAYMIVPLLYGLFGNYSAVLIGSGVQGIGDAIWDIGILAYVIRATPGREAIVFSLHLMLFGIRGSIAPLISTWLSHYVPISSLLLGASVCGALGTLVYLSHLKTNASKEQFS